MKSGLTVTNFGRAAFRLSYKRQRNAGSVDLPLASIIAPGETVFVPEPPRGVSVVLHMRAPMQMHVVDHVRDFADMAEQAFGEDWQTELARRSGRHIKAVRRWLSGVTPVPGPAIALVETMVKMKLAGLDP